MSNLNAVAHIKDWLNSPYVQAYMNRFSLCYCILGRSINYYKINVCIDTSICWQMK